MKALKIRIKSPQHSRRVQKILWMMGYHWDLSPEQVVLEDAVYAPFIYAEPDGCIMQGSDKSFFEEDSNEEVELGNESPQDSY